MQSTNTGAKEVAGKLSYELEWTFITGMAERMALNKAKYQPYNWKKPINIGSLKDALTRHFIAIQNNNHEDDGQEYGHYYAIACNAMMIVEQLKLAKSNATIQTSDREF